MAQARVAVQGSWTAALVTGAALWTMYGALLGSLGAAAKWSFTGKLEPHNGFSMYDSLSFRRALVLISEMPLGEPSPQTPRLKTHINSQPSGQQILPVTSLYVHTALLGR